MQNSNKYKSIRNTFTVIVLFSIGILSIIGSMHDDNGGNGDQNSTRPYLFSYIDLNWRLRIRYSHNGTTWTTPSQVAVPYADRSGGIASNAATLFLSIFQDSAGDMRRLSGLGHDIWDNNSYKIGNGHRGEVSSGTSIIHLDVNEWLAAYVHQNQAKFRKYDGSTGTKDFTSTIYTPVIGVINSGVIDKPAMANLNGRLLVSWLMSNTLQMVTGTVQGRDPVWDPGYRFEANVTHPGFGPPIGAHDIAHDGRRFYAAVVRKMDPVPGQQLERYFLFVYTSHNGTNWVELARRESANPQSMNIAARGTNDLIVMLSRAATTFPPAFTYHYNGNNWSVINPDNVFDTNPMNKGHDFSLVVEN